MSTIHDSKRQEVLQTPLLLFDCTLADCSVERWSTHRVTADGETYEPRILKHGGFDLRLAGDDAVDAGGRFTLVLANVDGRASQLDRSIGWKGARLRVRFGFFDIRSGLAATESTAVFLGIANPVDELTEKEARLSFTSRLSLQRLNVPTLRIQYRCPWRFPATDAERTEARDGGEYSAFYRCGYSAGVEEGAGNLNGGQPYESCNRTRGDCAARGMLLKDASGQTTARFGGFAYLPPSVLVRPHGEKSSIASEAMDGRARSNDAVPLVYGTAWINAPVIFARNDGNLTHCEVLLCSGPIEGVQKVIANGVELPLGESGKDMTATGWYDVMSLGARNGAPNLTFTDAQGQPAGDPHGSMACLAVVLPNQLMQQNRLPKVEVLLDGMQLVRYDLQGQALEASFTRNPAWILLDLLRRCGWDESELNIASIATTASFCDEFVEVTTPEGQTVHSPRFEANLALTQRRSLNDVVRGLRIGSALMVTVDENGRLMVSPEMGLAGQGAVLRESSNSTQMLAGGWPSYEFGDGLNGFSGILRKENGGSTFRIWRRGASEIPNRLSVEFQDAFNQYQQDSLSLVDFEDAAAQGCEVSAASGALGLPHFDQAARILRLQLQKNVRGNHFIEFESSVQALGLRPGDLIAISHSREGLDRAPYRVLRLTPALNYERVRIAAQRHEDSWYRLVEGGTQLGTRQGESGPGVPRPLAGRLTDTEGREEFEVVEGANDGAELLELAVRYTPPARPSLQTAAPPVVSLTPEIRSTGGTLAGARAMYYAVSSVDETGVESGLSYAVRASLPAGVDTYEVELTGIRCAKGSAGMRIYRGAAPNRLRKIADAASVSKTFTDAGLAELLSPPPDRNFDHAKLQWRFELLPATATNLSGATTIGNSELGMLPNEFAGAVVRILNGKGAGQERTIVSHTATEIKLSQPWTIPPDATSKFSVAEAGWKPAGITASDEIRFLVQNRPGEVVQIAGVAVSALGSESDAIVTRHEVHGSAGGDADVPGEPGFGITTSGQGDFEIGGIGFSDLANTNSIRTGTLTVHYWDELQSPSSYTTGAAMVAEGQSLLMAVPCPVQVGELVQVEGELLRVLEIADDGLMLTVERAAHHSFAVPHGSGVKVYPLSRRTVVLPFPKNFFGSAASGSYSHRMAMPGVRIAAAEFFVTNEYGESPTGARAYTMTVGRGLRTMSGGQYSVQFDGELAVMATVAPPLVLDRQCAVRDVNARVAVAPIVEPVVVRVLMNDAPYADLTIPAGAKSSAIADGFGRAPLPEGGVLTVSVLSVGTSGGSHPGRDLSVTIRI